MTKNNNADHPFLDNFIASEVFRGPTPLLGSDIAILVDRGIAYYLWINGDLCYIYRMDPANIDRFIPLSPNLRAHHMSSTNSRPILLALRKYPKE